MEEIRDCVIVGAGIAGLVAAHTLRQRGLAPVVLDKGSQVGGRLATRRIGGGVFDHGAQFFTARDWRFQDMVGRWQAAGVIKEWSRGFPWSDGVFPNDRFARFRGVNGMTTLAKHLAHDLEVRRGETVRAVAWRGDAWEVRTDGLDLFARAVILTPPVPQSVALLHAGHVEIAPSQSAILRQIAYEPCLAVMALLDGPTRLPAVGGLRVRGTVLQWIADNTRKGISPGAHAVTLHAAHPFSQEHWEDDDATVSRLLLAAAREWLGAGVVEAQVKRWRYAKPIKTHTERCLCLRADPPLLLAGDAFGGPRVEGAALSGLASAERVASRLALAA